MKLHELKKIVDAAMFPRNGNVDVVIDKNSFRHSLEDDGILIPVVNATFLPVPMSDGDGGTETTADGRERMVRVLKLDGGCFDMAPDPSWVDRNVIDAEEDMA